MEEQSDGSIIVSGLCTSDTVDLDDQIIDLDFSRKGLAQWAATFGNIRQMHSTNLPPAGKAIQIDTTKPDGVYLTARIVEPGAVKLCKEGVYSAFSVGISKPRIVRDKVAKQGRVLDGVFSEVSIVDFPALPTAKFNIIKRSKKEINSIEKTLTPIGTVIKRQSDEKGQTSVSTENEETVEKAVENCELCKGKGCEKCMGKAAEAEVEKGKVPKADREVTEDLDDASDAIDDAQDAQKEDNAAHEEGAFEDDDAEDDDSDDEEEQGEDDIDKSLTSVDGVAYALRRAHDAVCDAYSTDVIKTAHPAIETAGIKSVLQPEVIRALLSVIAVDGEPSQIASLAKAIGSAHMLSTMNEADVAMAREELHKAFSDAYPTAHPTPGSVTPGQFQRSYIIAGRTPQSSTGAKPRIPVTNSTIDGNDFNRDLITEGHESEAPESSGSPTPTNATAADRIAEATKDSAMNAMAALHDHISSAYPTICSLDQGAGVSYAGVTTLDTDGGIKPIAASATPQLTKSEKKALKQAKALKKARKLLMKSGELAQDDDNEEIEKIEEVNVVKASTSADGEVLIDTEQLNEIVKSLIEAQTKNKFDAFSDALSTIKSEVEKFGSEPDPAQAPIRGSVVVDRAVQKAATEADVLRQTAEDSLTEQVTYLRALTKSGNPELRMRAEKQLSTLLEKVSLEIEE